VEIEITKGLVLLVIIEVLLMFGFGYTYALDVKFVPVFPACPNGTVAVLRYEEQPVYEEMMEEINKRGYQQDVYDCSNMSIDLNSYLNNRGYTSRVECGWDNESAHAWVELKLYLDPTSNVIYKQRPIFPSYNYKQEVCDS